MTWYDAVLLSYGEPMADSLHARLQRTLGGTAKRLHGVHGMRRAYRLCAEVVDREQFFLADGDFAIAADFDPAAVEPLDEGVSMRVWRAVNPVSGRPGVPAGMHRAARQPSGGCPTALQDDSPPAYTRGQRRSTPRHRAGRRTGMVTELVMAAAEFVQAHHTGLQLGVTALRLAVEVARGVRWVVRRRGGRAA